MISVECRIIKTFINELHACEAELRKDADCLSGCEATDRTLAIDVRTTHQTIRAVHAEQVVSARNEGRNDRVLGAHVAGASLIERAGRIRRTRGNAAAAGALLVRGR